MFFNCRYLSEDFHFGKKKIKRSYSKQVVETKFSECGFLLECSWCSSPQNWDSQQWIPAHCWHRTLSGLHTMTSFLLGVLALLQCVPVMSFDGFFTELNSVVANDKTQIASILKLNSLKLYWGHWHVTRNWYIQQ